MSVLIRGMQMPKNCMNCPVRVGIFCQILNIDVDPFYDGGTARNAQCPLGDLGSHGDLIDRDALKNAVLKWMPPDPCGREEMEFPFETDICVSMMMEIEEQDAVIKAEEVKQ